MKSLQQLISEKESELQNLEDSLGLGFPIVEQAKMTQISHLRLESEDLRQIEKSIQLNDNQKIVLEWLKYPLNDIPNRFAKNYFAYVTCLFLGQAPDKVLKAYQELSLEQRRQVLAVFAQRGLEQEEAE
ncbi:TPA: hypothetical protein QFT43_000718 [Enterococcus faecium]|uniref:hypothetical protein n=1 Tax=Enterococcus TaxID=1350 RepID=UPI00189B47C0|nr:hypothetical protein [Enterococcus faecium]MDQ8406298.1 hypothetical protein [Enterococcus faecium]